MNKITKINLLYKKAHGQPLSKDEERELSKYKVDSDDGQIATRNNIAAYVDAVDQGCRLTFYDWCANNLRGDRRRRSGRADAISERNRDQGCGAIFLGWLLWGLAIYWMLDEKMGAWPCAIAGAIVSLLIQRRSRKNAGFTLFFLPIILMVVFGQ